MKPRAWLTAALLVHVPVSAPAADRPPAASFTDAVVISAHRHETPTASSGTSITVLDRREIETRRASSVAELLRTVPGVEIVQGGGPGRVASALIRGTASSHALVLIDGVRANDATTGAFDLADLSTDLIDRIEILRGPQSALYGSEAIGGVISIFTRRGAGEPRPNLTVELGTDDRWRLAGEVGGSGDRIDYQLSATGSHVDGVSAASQRSGNRETDPHDLRQLSARFGAALSQSTRLDVTSRLVVGESGLDGFDFLVGPVDDPNYRQERRGWTTSVDLERSLGHEWATRLHLGAVDERLEGVDPDTFFNNFRIDTRNLSLGVQAGGRLGGGRASFGADFEQRSGVNPGSFDEQVELWSLWGEQGWSPHEDLALTLGGRWDDHSRFGSELTYRGTGSWQVRPATRLRASYGTGFKAPTLNDLFFPFFGNPDLRPETSAGLDIGVSQRLFSDRGQLELTLFQIDLDDLIGLDDSFRAVNVARARSRGVELSLDAPLVAGLEIRSSYTWTDAEDRSTGDPLPRRPTHRAVVSLLVPQRGRWNGSLTLLAVADRVDTGGSEMDDYQRLDATVGLRLQRRLELYLRGENLLDENYEEVNGFTSPGLGIAAGVHWRP